MTAVQPFVVQLQPNCLNRFMPMFLVVDGDGRLSVDHGHKYFKSYEKFRDNLDPHACKF